MTYESMPLMVDYAVIVTSARFVETLMCEIEMGSNGALIGMRWLRCRTTSLKVSTLCKLEALAFRERQRVLPASECINTGGRGWRGSRRGGMLSAHCLELRCIVNIPAIGCLALCSSSQDSRSSPKNEARSGCAMAIVCS